MKTIKLLILFSVVSFAVVITGCKKDNSNDPNQNAPEFKSKSVTIPDAMAQSNDPGAQMAVNYLNMINSMSSYEGMMKAPGKSALIHYKDGGDTYTWEVNDNSGSYTVTMTVTETPLKIVWEMRITGNMDGHELTNFLFIHAYQKKDETGSDFLVYDIETGDEYMDISWNIIGDGATEYRFEVFQETLLKVIVNTDGSGSLEFNEWVNTAYVLTYQAVWDASGHGQYWEYEGGQVIDQGAW